MSTVILDGGPKDGTELNLEVTTYEVAFPIASRRFIDAADQTRWAYYQRSEERPGRFVFTGYQPSN